MFTRTLVPLMHREWLQHRFGWAVLALVPLTLALLTSVFGEIEFDGDFDSRPEQLPLLLTTVPAIAGTALMLTIGLVTAFIAVSGLARRDHADRSIEYWLSLPVPHSAALGVPMVVHLLLMPAAALAIGWLGGQAMGLLLLGRLAGAGAFAEVPWAATAAATLSVLLRGLAGLPLAVLWVLPLVLVLMLLNAWFKRWGWVVMVVGGLLMSLFERLALGQRWLLDISGGLLRHAGLSLMGAGGGAHLSLGKGDGVDALLGVPALAANDLLAAITALASPLFVGAMAFSAACFALLLQWRRQGAARGD